jgi:hypothetical protein
MKIREILTSGTLPFMGNREKWTIGMAILGGIAASVGEFRNPIDTILGATINGAITYGIATIYISSQKSKQTKTTTTSTTNEKTTMTRLNFDDSQIHIDMREYLQTLEVVPGRNNGWYKDPANLYLLRYFHNGKWTLAVSFTDSETDKNSALSEYRRPDFISTSKTEPLVSKALTNQLLTTSSTSNSVGISQKIEHLERIAELRNRDMISEGEYEQLKKDVLG